MDPYIGATASKTKKVGTLAIIFIGLILFGALLTIVGVSAYTDWPGLKEKFINHSNQLKEEPTPKPTSQTKSSSSEKHTKNK